MLISREKRFLFIHIQKTAGTSLRNALSAGIPDLQNFGGTHDTAAQARSALGADYDSFFSAAFVRNPWDRLVSWYSMIVQQRPPPRRLWSRSSQRVPRLWHYVYENSANFEQFVRKCTAEIDDFDGVKSFTRNQIDYVADEDGRRIVDFVGRYENFAVDANQILRRLELAEGTFEKVNTSRHDHYSAYYTDELAEVVSQRFRRDAEAFGYRFDRVSPPLFNAGSTPG